MESAPIELALPQNIGDGLARPASCDECSVPSELFFGEGAPTVQEELDSRQAEFETKEELGLEARSFELTLGEVVAREFEHITNQPHLVVQGGLGHESWLSGGSERRVISCRRGALRRVFVSTSGSRLGAEREGRVHSLFPRISCWRERGHIRAGPRPISQVPSANRRSGRPSSHLASGTQSGGAEEGPRLGSKGGAS